MESPDQRGKPIVRLVSCNSWLIIFPNHKQESNCAFAHQIANQVRAVPFEMFHHSIDWLLSLPPLEGNCCLFSTFDHIVVKWLKVFAAISLGFFPKVIWASLDTTRRNVRHLHFILQQQLVQRIQKNAFWWKFGLGKHHQQNHDSLVFSCGS